MRVCDRIRCSAFPCEDVNHACHVVPGIDVDPAGVSILLISEAAPADPGDYYYAEGDPLFQQTTVQAFRDAGADVSSIQDILGMGVYLTTAVKCGKTGYGIKAATIQACSLLLEEEIALFPDVSAFLLMGDVAIKGINYVAKRAGTKIKLAFTPVASCAMRTESNTGIFPSRTHSPPFPGVTPATTCVP